MNWKTPINLAVALIVLVATPNCDLNAVIQDADDSKDTEARFLSNIQQLTIEGRRAGEGYFSADGRKLVFQSERVEGNPFFQMFVLDLEFGDVTQISPGHGKTTCGWIHPDGKTVMYASTQHDPEAKAKQRQELELREQGRQSRYSWDYDETYEIYNYDMQTKKYRRLTNAKGYDAEGSYSPDGKLIAFASNRKAYSHPMTEKQQEKFAVKKAYMMDIYIMNSDGSNVRQLTNVDGYDGGPFFSPDGKRICWRRFDENEVTAEIMTMNIDGSDVKQLTNMRYSSFAPFYHPTGRYLIFTSNKYGFGNFELFLVDVDGKSPPVRVTTTNGFDGLPSFSPDGSKIYWTSTRHDVKARLGQLYRADWNHENALQALVLGEATSAEESEAMQIGTTSANETKFDFDGQDIMRHVDYLCRKELGGRMTGTAGERKATAYVAAYLENMGVLPDGDNGSWFQEFEFPDGADLGARNQLLAYTGRQAEIVQQEYDLKQQWQPLTFSKNGTAFDGSVVFAGYGIDAGEDEDQPAYDSYDQLDVKDKWVMMLRYWPEDVAEERMQQLQYNSKLRKKAMVARDKGAKGMIIVSGPNSNVRDQLVPVENDFSQSGSSIAAISVTDEVAASWLKRAERDIKQLQDELDSGTLVPGFEIPGLMLKASIDIQQRVGTGRNVIGRLQMSDVPSEQAILIGAHIDHLGRGTAGSLARNEEKNKIHFGADDNASGVAAMLEVAEFLSGLKRGGKLKMQRDIIFAAWSGEEIGLHGSQHFVTQRIPRDISAVAGKAEAVDETYQGDPHDLPALIKYYERLVEGFDAENFTSRQLQLLKLNVNEMRVVIGLLKSPVADSGQPDNNSKQRKQVADLLARANEMLERAESSSNKNGNPQNGTNTSSPAASSIKPIVACLNMDMVGRMKRQLVLQGLGSSRDWNRIIEKANVVVGLPVKPSDDTQLPTDASSFYRAGVPILSAFTGSHTDYHTPRDTPEKLNYPDAARIAKLMGLISRDLAVSDGAPEYVKQAPAENKRVARSGRRARLGSIPNYTEKVTGVLLDDVSTDSPAEKAGLKRGDVIIGLAGRKIENIYDYQYAIDGLKVGKETEVIVLRDNKKLTLKITPGSRD